MKNELKVVSDFLLAATNLKIINIIDVGVNKKYHASQFYVSNLLFEFRVANITPKKQGGFVALWKKILGASGVKVNIPYALSDFNFCIIYIGDVINSGLFIFTNSVLQDQKILSSNNRGGKLGFRIYPKWVNLKSEAAQNTQSWQQKYFINFADSQEENIVKLKSILNQEILQ